MHLTATAAIDETIAIVPLKRILAQRNVTIHQGRVIQIESLHQHVRLREDGQILEYDRLVIVIGAQPDYGGITGASEYTFPLRTFTAAQRLREHIVACFAAATHITDSTLKRRALTFGIVGGGYTGCQFAGELAVWVGKYMSRISYSPYECTCCVG